MIAALTGGVVAVVLTGCARPVAVTPPQPDPSAITAAATRLVCAHLAAALPSHLGDGDERTTTPDSDATAAWGDPPVVLRCGVPRPAALEPTSQLITVDGVDWFPEELTEGYVFTTYGRVVNVEIAVPAGYAPEAGVLTDLGAVVSAADPLVPQP